jgi:hypothetical protein
MFSPQPFLMRSTAILCSVFFSVACGGSGAGPVAPTVPGAQTPPVAGAVVLKTPVLSFNDTGLDVTDGVTSNGRWGVESQGIDWEFSLDQGASWTRGSGGSFVVKGDGAKMIWVRARDDAGNTSEIVRVNCVLDTTPPAAVAISGQSEGVTNTFKLSGIEPGARWEYSLDEQRTWSAGKGSALGALGNGLSRVWLRQVDMAGNHSSAQGFDLQNPSVVSHEASGDPLMPSILAPGLQTYLIHGVVVRGDRDYVTWDIPKGQQLMSVKLVQYESEDDKAFYALQPNKVFDAGETVESVSRMLVYGHMGPSYLGRNELTNVPKSKLGEGPMTLWFQQTGISPTRYAIEVILSPAD